MYAQCRKYVKAACSENNTFSCAPTKEEKKKDKNLNKN